MVKKNDTVQILAGKDRGKRGKVLTVEPRAGRLTVEGLNIRKKHVRPRRANEKGQVIDQPGPLPVSRVMLVCPSCQKAVRVAHREVDGKKKERYCRKCSATIA